MSKNLEEVLRVFRERRKNVAPVDPAPAVALDSERVYKVAARKHRREHLTRIMGLAVCAGLYGRFNLAQGDLDAEIAVLNRRFSHRFPERGPQ